MNDKAHVLAFAGDPYGVRPGSFANRTIGWGRLGPTGVIGIFVPNADDSGRPCGQDVYNSRVESWHRNLGLLFDAPGMGPDSGRSWFVFCLAPDVAQEAWDRFIVSVRQCRVLWSVSAVDIVGPSGYERV